MVVLQYLQESNLLRNFNAEMLHVQVAKKQEVKAIIFYESRSISEVSSQMYLFHQAVAGCHS